MNRNIVVIGSLEEKRRVELGDAEKNAKTIARLKFGISGDELYSSLFFVSFKEKEKLGSYVPEQNIILLSEDLLQIESNDLKNVFLHECAHSLDYHVYGKISGHGARFREFCSILGVNEDFNKAKIRKEFKRDERIEKLLALSSSPFAGEAAAAMSKAQELIKERRIKDKEEEEKVYSVELYECKRQPFFIKEIKHFVEKITGAFIVDDSKDGIRKTYVDIYGNRISSRTTYTTTLRAFGKIDEVEATLYLFDYLCSSVDIETKKLKEKGKKVSKDSFTLAMIKELDKKIFPSGEDKEIVLINKENGHLAEKLYYKENLVSEVSVTYSRMDKESYNEGKKFGQNLDLEKNKTKRIED